MKIFTMPVMRDRSILFLIVVILMSVACGTVSKYPVPGKKPEHSIKVPSERPVGKLPDSAKPKYNLTGYPVNTQQGYIDGCETAKNTSWAFKDLNRYEKDDQYRMGWDDGFSMCKGKK